MTTPAELAEIAGKAATGVEPHANNVEWVLDIADRSWNYDPKRDETCDGADTPAWNDNGGGTKILLAKAYAYHLTGDTAQAVEVQLRAISLLPPGDSDLRSALESALLRFEAALAEESE